MITPFSGNSVEQYNYFDACIIQHEVRRVTSHNKRSPSITSNLASFVLTWLVDSVSPSLSSSNFRFMGGIPGSAFLVGGA
jgi:hypothetical protein